MSFQPPHYIAIEGPMRVGKSSLTRLLAERLHAHTVVDHESNPFLGEFYEGKPGAAFRAQMHFLHSRFARLRELEPARSHSPIVADFLFEKDKIFAYINLSDVELRLYEAYYELLHAQVPVPDLVIYLQAPPQVLQERILRKARQMGSRLETGISEAYLEEVVQAYEHFFFHYRATRLLVINTAEIDFVERREDLEELLHRLTQPVFGTQYFLPLGSAGDSESQP